MPTLGKKTYHSGKIVMISKDFCFQFQPLYVLRAFKSLYFKNRGGFLRAVFNLDVKLTPVFILPMFLTILLIQA